MCVRYFLCELTSLYLRVASGGNDDVDMVVLFFKLGGEDD
jgi:hypothetical protein